MAKRYVDTNLWEEDWFLALKKNERLFWRFICDKCDHAGIWKPNWEQVRRVAEIRNLDVRQFLKGVNQGKQRVMVLENGRWWITGFIAFQYGETLKTSNNMHKSVVRLLDGNKIPYRTTSYGFEVKETSLSPSLGAKDKDKDISKRGVRGEIILPGPRRGKHLCQNCNITHDDPKCPGCGKEASDGKTQRRQKVVEV